MSEVIEISKDESVQLRESESLFRQMADSSPALMWVSDTDSACKWFNRPWLNFRGSTMEQETGKGWTGGVHQEDLDGCLGTYLKNFKERAPFRMEYRLLRADGEFRWILDQGNPRFTASGEFLGYIGSCTDITEMRQFHEIQDGVTKKLGELAAIVASSDDVIISKNLDGTITSWNAAASRLFGYSEEEMIGASILTLIPEALHSDEKAIIASICAGKRVDHFETKRRTKDGRLIDVSLTVSPVKNGAGQIVGASKILRDISTRKRVEESLLQAEKVAAAGRMAATIAHEINNPLEAVMNLIFLARPLVHDPAAVKYLESAESELIRVSHLAKQTLGFYRETASATSLSLSDIAKHAASIYEPRCKVSNVELGLHLTSTRKLMLRRGEMMQVISNLISNAIHAMPDGGLLQISVKDEDELDGVVLLVRDNGSGISEENLSRVFEAFFTTRSSIGTGIGLFVVKQFVEGHGGAIDIESSTDEVHHGTTVRIFLPLSTSYAERPQ